MVTKRPFKPFLFRIDVPLKNNLGVRRHFQRHSLTPYQFHRLFA
jgi:hypothetical protein